MIRRQARYAQINDLGPHLGLNTAVLWNPVLGNHHARLNLESRNDGRLQPFRRRTHFLHHPVNAVAQAETLGQRFQMNIRRAQLERVHDDLVDQPDQRRIHFHIRPLICQPAEIHLGHRHFLDDILERTLGNRLFLATVILAERRLDVRLRRHAQFDFRPQKMVEGINRVQVGGIRNGHGNLLVGLEKGNNAIFFGDVATDERDDIVLDLHRREMDDFRAELRRLGLGDVPGPDDFVGDQIIYNAGSARFRTRLGDLFSRCKAQVHQHVQQVIVFFCHVFGCVTIKHFRDAVLKFSFADTKVNA